MAKIATIKPLLAALPSQLRRMTGDEKERHRQRDADQKHRRWYKTAKWQKLRQKILVRDSYTCQRTGVLCIGQHPADNSPVVDHIEPHRGNLELFWDESNLQCVSKAFHDSEKQREEKRGQPSWG